MKKVLSLVLALLMIFSCTAAFTSCYRSEVSVVYICPSCKEENPAENSFCSNCGESFDNDSTEKEETESQKSAEEILREYILENGENYQGTYKITETSEYINEEIEVTGTYYTTISCTEYSDISFFYETKYSGSVSQTESVTLNFYEGSVIQSLEYSCAKPEYDYYLNATGTLETASVGLYECQVTGITYTENCPNYMENTVEYIEYEFSNQTRMMLNSINTMLSEKVNINLTDLGFTNCVIK